MSRPSLSVILPNYNHGHCLPQAIEAVVSQSRPPEEFLILDDASTDNSIEIIESHARRYPCIHVARNECNLGVVASLRALLAMATGDYVYSGAADDYVLPGFFEGAMGMAERYPEAGVLCGKVVVASPTGQEMFVVGIDSWPEPVFAPPEVYLRDCVRRAPNSHFLSHATIYRRAALEEVGGFRPELGHFTDNFAILAIALKYGACYVPERCAVNRAMPGGFAANRGKDTEAMLRLSAQAVSLMHSPEFRDRFPEDYVTGWKRNFERWVFDCYVFRLREPFGTSFWGRWKGRLLKQYLRLKVALRYRGNVVSFLQRQLKQS